MWYNTLISDLWKSFHVFSCYIKLKIWAVWGIINGWLHLFTYVSARQWKELQNTEMLKLHRERWLSRTKAGIVRALSVGHWITCKKKRAFAIMISLKPEMLAVAVAKYSTKEDTKIHFCGINVTFAAMQKEKKSGIMTVIEFSVAPVLERCILFLNCN